MKKVFLGGTCNGSTWREKLIPLLRIDYFNPVVENWTPECQAEEIKQRQECDFMLYLITPKMTGVYSIAEVVDDSHRRPEKTIFAFKTQDEDDSFTPHQIKSLEAVGRLVESNGATWVHTWDELAAALNG